MSEHNAALRQVHASRLADLAQPVELCVELPVAGAAQTTPSSNGPLMSETSSHLRIDPPEKCG